MDHLTFAQLLGNYGEFVGAIAVVVTLGYLAVQIRQNTRSQDEHRKAVVAQSARDVDLYLANWHLEMAQNAELKRVMQESQPMDRRREDYSDLEWYELHCLAASLLFPFQAQYIHGQLQVGHDEQLHYQLGIAKGMVTNLPVWRDWWEQVQEDQLFAPGFMKAVNDHSGFVPDMQNVFPDRS